MTDTNNTYISIAYPGDYLPDNCNKHIYSNNNNDNISCIHEDFYTDKAGGIPFGITNNNINNNNNTKPNSINIPLCDICNKQLTLIAQFYIPNTVQSSYSNSAINSSGNTN